MKIKYYCDKAFLFLSIIMLMACSTGESNDGAEPSKPTVINNGNGGDDTPGGSSSDNDESTSSYLTITVGKVSFKMIRVEGGTFMMGATQEQQGDAWSNEKPVHEVTLSTYYIGETEVTQELWETVMGSNPSKFKQSRKPVDGIGWYDCETFIHNLNTQTGRKFRFPTEAEWEFAARGGKSSKGYKFSGSNIVDDVAWSEGADDSGTHTVATKQANELGIYDMSGNVWEWCNDWFGEYPSTSVTNPQGPSSGTHHVRRGGSWWHLKSSCRVSCRAKSSFSADKDEGGSTFGLRIVL